MIHQKNTSRYFLYFTPLCLAASVLVLSLYYWHIKKELQDNFLGMRFIVESNTSFRSILYYTFNNEFNETLKIENSGTSEDTLLFMFPRIDGIVKKVRLDLGNDPLLKTVKIKTMQLDFKGKRIQLSEQEVFDNLFINSASISLNREQNTIEIRSDQEPFDPYIVFSPLGEIVKSRLANSFSLLLPFLIFIVFYIIKIRKDHKMKVLDLLVLLFIICIPLKIAWTTFTTLLLCVYGIVHSFKKGNLGTLNSTFYLFVILFSVIMLLGRPSNLSAIDNYWALLLFAIISITVPFKTFSGYRSYVYFMLVFNAIIVSSGLGFLLWFHEFYALGIFEYFKGIKIYSGHVRDWLFYDHAAFLSFFGLIGMLFAHKLFQNKELDKKFINLYHILLLSCIILVGARIGLLIYMIFLINLLFKWSGKQRLLINSILFIVISTMLVFNIHKLDQNRYRLWSVSREAILEKPWFGHGLGASNELLHDSLYIKRAGFSEALELNHSHNQFITFFMEVGLLGFLLLTIFLGYFLYRSREYKNTSLILFLFGLGYMFLSESILETSKPLYVICFIFLMLTSHSNWNGRHKTQI